MMTKVEELREIAIHVAAMGFGEMSEYHGYNIGMYNEEKEAERLVDDLITAAKKEERERIRQASERVETLSEAYHAVECHFPPITPLFIVPELMLMLSEEEYPSLEKWVEGQGYGVKL